MFSAGLWKAESPPNTKHIVCYMLCYWCFVTGAFLTQPLPRSRLKGLGQWQRQEVFLCPWVLEELQPALTVRILLPSACQGRCKNESVVQPTPKSYLNKADCGELCPVGSLLPHAWTEGIKPCCTTSSHQNAQRGGVDSPTRDLSAKFL